ncbi:MAG: DUF475 domain-containing protein [Candidatus Pacebacteria bacterium]|jgi:hypothetical protein|nr:DUF475 domain-containing protein [Candidatus Paceibacterota bacterium]
MDIISSLLIIGGLVLFEIINSIDNAIINAHVLKSMSKKWRRIFLVWGMFFAVFVVRGILPLLIVWMTVPGIGFVEAFWAMFSSSPEVAEAVEAGKPMILMGSGVFLLLLYLHWLFLEKKIPFFIIDRFVKPHHGIWFFGLAALLLVALLYSARQSGSALMISAAIGNAAFFILYGFREQAEKESEFLKKNKRNLGDLSKLLYLEILDMSFSFDGVLGAFAFTTAVPLILIGNGIGALAVRQLTIKGIDRVAKYRYLKNGAMSSVGVLGVLIICESFGLDFPDYLPPLITFMLVGAAFWESRRLMRKKEKELAYT